jgi:hypothetical protein
MRPGGSQGLPIAPLQLARQAWSSATAPCASASPARRSAPLNHHLTRRRSPQLPAPWVGDNTNTPGKVLPSPAVRVLSRSTAGPPPLHPDDVLIASIRPAMVSRAAAPELAVAPPVGHPPITPARHPVELVPGAVPHHLAPRSPAAVAGGRSLPPRCPRPAFRPTGDEPQA